MQDQNQLVTASYSGIQSGVLQDIRILGHRPNIFDDGIAFAQKWDFSKANLNEANRIRVITQVASICYQSPKSLGSESLYNRLAAESMGLPSSSFEFVPVLLDPWNSEAKKILEDQRSNVRKFGEWIKFINPETGKEQEALLTNYRAIYYDYETRVKLIREWYAGRVDSPENANALIEHEKVLKHLYLNFFNTEKECEIISEHFNVFLYKVDFPTRSQMVRHRVNWQELCISGDSMITTLQGKRSIKDLYENQSRKSSNKLPKVRTYDFNEKRLVWSEIKEVFNTGKKPVYEVIIQTGGKGNKLKIKSTENHKFLTNEGWKELKDISVGNFVATNGIFILDNLDELKRITIEMINNKVIKKEYAEQFNISELALVKRLQKINMVYSDVSFEITNYHLVDWCIENKQKMIEIGNNFKEMAEYFNINLNTLSKWFRRHNIIYSKEEIALLKKPAWNKGLVGEDSHSYGLSHSDETREKISKKLAKPLGETTLGFKFRVHSYWQADFRKSKILKSFGNKCAKCATEDLSDIELDHIKPVRLYPNLAFEESNIQPLCKKCHIEKNLEEKSLNDHTYCFNFVESITLIGEEDTYDIEVNHPDHNYVANGIIVHNSRRYVSGKRVRFDFYISEGMKHVATKYDTIAISKSDSTYKWEDAYIDVDTEKAIDICLQVYFAALEQGIKPQEARRIIPQAAYTQIWGAFMPSQLENYFKLRLDEHAQWEIRKTAEAMQSLNSTVAILKDHSLTHEMLDRISSNPNDFLTSNELDDLLNVADARDQEQLSGEEIEDLVSSALS